MNRKTDSSGTFESLEARRALGFFRLLKAVVDGRDPYPMDEDARDEPALTMMQVPVRLRRAHQPIR